jgi:hypothetical protein
MTIAAFVARVLSGEVMCGGGLAGTELVDGVTTLAPNVDAITAEAFNQGIVDSERYWDDVRKEVVTILTESSLR